MANETSNIYKLDRALKAYSGYLEKRRAESDSRGDLFAMATLGVAALEEVFGADHRYTKDSIRQSNKIHATTQLRWQLYDLDGIFRLIEQAVKQLGTDEVTGTDSGKNNLAQVSTGNVVVTISELEIEKAVWQILEAASTCNFELQLMPSTLSETDAVKTKNGRVGLSDREAVAAALAFNRMLYETHWVRHEQGVFYKVSEQGRSAWTRYETMNAVALIAVFYSEGQKRKIQSWSATTGATISLWFNASEFLPDNVANLISENKPLIEADVSGFVIADTAEFPQSAVEALYKVLSRANHSLYAANRGEAPFLQSDFPMVATTLEEGQQVAGAAERHVYTTNIHITGGQTVIQAPGSVTGCINQTAQTTEASNSNLSEVLDKLSTILHEIEISAHLKNEGVERVSVLAEEVKKPVDKQMPWQITENLKNLGEFLKGLGTAYEGYEKVRPYLETIPALAHKLTLS